MSENIQELEKTKKKLEIKKLIKENIILIFSFIALIISIFDSLNIRSITIPDFSKRNSLTPPHIETKISFKNSETTTAATFWYYPKENKNQGFKLKIVEGHHVLINSSNDIEISVLNSQGDYIPLVSFSKLDWVFKANKTDDYRIVINGELNSKILIDIPPKTKKENIIEIDLKK